MDVVEGVLLLLTGGIYPALWYVDRRAQRLYRRVNCLIDLHLRYHPEDEAEISRACQEE